MRNLLYVLAHLMGDYRSTPPMERFWLNVRHMDGEYVGSVPTGEMLNIRKGQRTNIVRSWFYQIARLLGDLSAIRKGRILRRIGRRVAGKATGWMMRGLFG